MNVVFYLIVLIVIVFLWFTLAFMFKPIGRFISRLIEDAKNEMSSNEKEN